MREAQLNASAAGRDPQWRKAIEASVNSGDCMLVADIGGTNIKVGLLSRGKVHEATEKIPSATLDCEDPLRVLASHLRRHADRAGVSPALAVLTVPGLIDRDFDHVIDTLFLPTLKGRAIASEVGNLLGIPVVLERDAVLLLQGECEAGAARGYDNVLGVFFGTGIGAAFISDNKPFRGGGWALELGHVPIRSPLRREPVGISASLESVASGHSLAELSRRHGVPIDAVFRRRRESRSLSKSLDELVLRQALSVAGTIAILSPEMVVVGGGVVFMDAYPWDQFRRHLAGLMPVGPEIAVKKSELGWESALYGALHAAKRELA